VLNALLGCTSLPEYAAPKASVVRGGSVDLSDVITYRTLERADFKAEQPPPEFGGAADRLGAATCGHILTTPDSGLSVAKLRDPDGAMAYTARPHNLRFRALMNRSCSWWNPKDLGLPQDYILEHEQIHFALFELEARHMNAELPAIEANLHATASSPRQAAALFQQQLEDYMRGRLHIVVKRSREFDEDTSMGHNPGPQKRWLSVVTQELAAL
jgi:hypothetical protein